MAEEIHQQVQEFYGKRVKSADQLLSNVCTSASGEGSARVKEAIKIVHPEILSKYYGCGLVFPEAVEGCRVLDLGSGAGRDCFVLSQLVGPMGHVTGVDMTQEQLDVANKHIAYHMEEFGYNKPNVDFKKGFIEHLEDAGIAESSYDVVISNCVVNLAHDKLAVLKGTYNALKDGGEFYFSDVYVDRIVPDELRKNSVLWGECISGALYWKDLVTLAMEVGFAPPMVVLANEISCCGSGNLIDSVKSDPSIANRPELLELLGQLSVASVTYRLFKVSKTTAKPVSMVKLRYKGTITESPGVFKLSHNISIPVATPVEVPASMAQLLMDSRMRPHFEVVPLLSSSSEAMSKSADMLASVNPFDIIAASSAQCCQTSQCCN